jgi:hypothetical protein
MDNVIEQCLASLHSRHINGMVVENPVQAREKILAIIPQDAVVGIGDSTTIRQIGITKVLKDRGTKVLDAFEPQDKDAYDSHAKIVKEATVCDVFLTGTNAITLDGKLVNVDAAGNRVAGMFWGHPLSAIIVGRNKIVKNLEEALQRIRNVIAPNHIRIRSAELGGREFRTPCVTTGECSDCRAEDRACNVFTIIEGKPFRTNLNVIVVDQDLGLSWNPEWAQDRIIQIIENYKKYVWIPK